VAFFLALAIMPAARLSDRIGRKRVIYASCVAGAVGLALGRRGAGAAGRDVGAAIFAGSAGAFRRGLGSDERHRPEGLHGSVYGNLQRWPRPRQVPSLWRWPGRGHGYHQRVLGYGTGPRAALLMGVLCYIIGAANASARP